MSTNKKREDLLPKHNGGSQVKGLGPIDLPQFYLLVALYFLQGIPIGLAFGAIPFLLKSLKVSYTQVGVFSLATYPYSLKLLWSPIVDSFYKKSVGRRRSWIIPIQFFAGSCLLLLGFTINTMFDLESATADGANINVQKLMVIFFLLIFLCATQDIAVDGWALEILSEQALSYASTAQTVGLNTGYFLSFTVFLAFNSSEFCNKYLRSIPQDYGMMTLSGYLKFAGIMYIVVNLYVLYFTKEEVDHLTKRKHDDHHGDANIQIVYKSMLKMLRLPAVQSMVMLHLVAKIGYQANEAATNLKLLERGFKREDLAITVLVDFPFEIIFGYYVAQWSSGKNSLKPWLIGFMGRLTSAALASVLVANFPADGVVTKSYFIMVILQHLLGSFMSTVQFVSISAFHTKIADPLIGGTYMTLLNTVSNLGGTWPRIIVLKLIDHWTVAECVKDGETLFSVFGEHDKQKCATMLGNVVTLRDGYYFTNMLCISIALVLFVTFIRPKVKQLQSLPPSAWRAS